MKRTIITIALSALMLNTGTASAALHLDPSNSHFGWGVGMAFTELPFSMSELKLPLSYLYYDRQFTDPAKPVRVSVEGGCYAFGMVIPVPEIGSNLYIGSEESIVQGKIGVGGFWDPAVANHAGFVTKAGVILHNRFDISMFVVPDGTDAKRSYQEFLGLESEEEADAFYAEHGDRVIFPYFGFFLTLRR